MISKLLLYYICNTRLEHYKEYIILVSCSQTHPTASEGKGLVDYYRASYSNAFPGYPGKALDKCVTNVFTQLRYRIMVDNLHTEIES